MNWESGDKLLEAAQEARNQGSYSTAVEHYERFVEKFANHDKYSTARVELAMVRIRRTVEGRNYTSALNVARDELKAVDNEAEFALAEEELTELLPRIAQGLADQADKSDDIEQTQSLIDSAEAALTMCENTRYIPKQLRDESELNTIRETLTRIERRQQSLSSLASTVAAIDQAIGDGDVKAAYAARADLLDAHPELFDNQALVEALQRISQAEQEGVTFVEETLAAETAEPASAVVATLALANRRVAGTAPTTAPVVVVAGGVAYGLRGEDGGMLWRRYLGPQIQPHDPVEIGGDVLLVDARRQELLRLAAETGALRWRITLGEAASRPVVLGDKVLVAGESGKLQVIDLAAGNRVGFVQFAQPLRSAPAVDDRAGRIYLVGDQTSVYTLATDDFRCLGVFFSGHAPGTISSAPAVVLNKVVVVENDGVETSRLRLLGLSGESVIDRQLAEARLEGLATSTPAVSGRRFVLATDRGAVSVYDVNPASDGDALTLLGTQTRRARQPFPRLVAVEGRHIWFAGNDMSKMVVAPTGGRLIVQEISDDYRNSQFGGSLIVREGVVLHTRRRAGKSGVTMTATDAAAGKTIWETDIATPPAGGVLVSDAPASLTLSDANGQVFHFDRDAISSRVQDSALPSARGDLPPLAQSLSLANGGSLFAAPDAADHCSLPTDCTTTAQEDSTPRPPGL